MTDAHFEAAEHRGHGRRHGRHPHHHHDRSPEQAKRHKRDQAVFHELLRRHDAIRREVTEIPGGIRAETWSDDPELAALIRDHAAEMHRRLEEGFSLRHWDPPFAEIFARKDQVRLTVSETGRGVRIEEVSDDPNVEILIRAHGAVVTGFVEHGGKRAATPTALPEGYRPFGS